MSTPAPVDTPSAVADTTVDSAPQAPTMTDLLSDILAPEEIDLEVRNLLGETRPEVSLENAPSADDTDKHPTSAPAEPAPAPSPEASPDQQQQETAVQTEPPGNDARQAPAESLEQFLSRYVQPPQPPQPQPPQPQPPQPQPPQPQPSSAAPATENEWVQRFLQESHLSEKLPVTPDVIDALVEGGETAVSAFRDTLSRAVATAVLEARRTIYNDLDPVLRSLVETVRPLAERDQALARVAAEQQFLQKYPQAREQLDVFRNVAEYLVNQPSLKVNALDEFYDLVFKVGSEYLQREAERWAPKDLANRPWWELMQHRQAGTGKQPNSPTGTAQSTGSRRSIPAPVAHAPAGAVQSSVGRNDWHRQVARSLID